MTALDASKKFGQSNPAFAVTYSGFVDGDTPGSLDGSLTFTTAATSDSPVGKYAIEPGGLKSHNYDITFADGTLTVSPDNNVPGPAMIAPATPPATLATTLELTSTTVEANPIASAKITPVPVYHPFTLTAAAPPALELVFRREPADGTQRRSTYPKQRHQHPDAANGRAPFGANRQFLAT